MARNFVRATPCYLLASSTPITAIPVTVSAWVNPTVSNLTQDVVRFGKATDAYNFFDLSLESDAKLTWYQRGANQGTFPIVKSAASYPTNAWSHVAGQSSATNAHAVWLNGVKATSTTAGNAIDVGGLTRMAIGIDGQSLTGNAMSGQIAEVGVWNVALSDGEISMLASGVPPRKIRPESLVFNDRLRDLWTYDEARGLSLTDVGPTRAADDPPQLQRDDRRKVILYSFGASIAVIFRNRTGSRGRLALAA